MSSALRPSDKNVVLRRGVLTKQGGKFRTWKKRFFAVFPTVLIYYEKESDLDAYKSASTEEERNAKVLGSIPLTDVCMRSSFSQSKLKNNIWLTGPDRNFRFYLEQVFDESGKEIDADCIAFLSFLRGIRRNHEHKLAELPRYDNLRDMAIESEVLFKIYPGKHDFTPGSSSNPGAVTLGADGELKFAYLMGTHLLISKKQKENIPEYVLDVRELPKLECLIVGNSVVIQRGVQPPAPAAAAAGKKPASEAASSSSSSASPSSSAPTEWWCIHFSRSSQSNADKFITLFRLFSALHRVGKSMSIAMKALGTKRGGKRAYLCKKMMRTKKAHVIQLLANYRKANGIASAASSSAPEADAAAGSSSGAFHYASTSLVESAKSSSNADAKERLAKGMVFIKYGARGKPHKKLVRFDWKGSKLIWENEKEPKDTKSTSIDIKSVTRGQKTALFMKRGDRNKEHLSFSIIGKERDLDLQAPDEYAYELEIFIGDLEQLLGLPKSAPLPPPQ